MEQQARSIFEHNTGFPLQSFLSFENEKKGFSLQSGLNRTVVALN